MRIDKTRIIAGMPILKVRDLLRKLSMFTFTRQTIAYRAKVSDRRSLELLHAFLREGLIELEGRRDGERRYQLTRQGQRLCAASGLPPISRERAEKMLADFLSRVREVNRRKELAYIVDQVTVFGSYLTTRKTLGDIDLAVDLEWRDPKRERWAYNDERIRITGAKPPNYVDRLFFCMHEVLMILKARNPYIAFSRPEEITRLRRKRVIFERKKKVR